MALTKFCDDDDKDDDDVMDSKEENEEVSEDDESDDADDDGEKSDDDDDDESGDGDDDDDDDAGKGELSKSDSKAGTKPENSLSKRSRKKLEKYAIDKTKRRAAEKERRKRRAAECREQKEKDPDGDIEGFAHKRKRIKQNKMDKSQCKLRIAVDCSFDELMQDLDISKLCKQIQSAYTMNRRLANPLQFYITGLNDESKVKTKFDQVYQGSANWNVHRESQGVTSTFSPDEVVYLTSDSPNLLDKLEDSKVYVIGGLSDQDRHTGHCFKTACAAGLTHARLPIAENVEAPTCHVLTVSRTFGALAAYSENGSDWKKALNSIMPKKREIPDGQQQQKTGPSIKKKKRSKRGGKKHRLENQTGNAKNASVAVKPVAS